MVPNLIRVFMKMQKSFLALVVSFMSVVFSFAQDNGGSYCLEKGYKGFVDFSCGKGLGLDGTGRAILSGVYGYQFVPAFFAGAGFGYDFNNKIKLLFVDVRTTMAEKFSPFAEVKIGTNLDDSRLYLSPCLGCRYVLNERMAINIGLALDYTRTWHYDYVPYMHYSETTGTTSLNTSSISSLADNYSLCLKVGVEF